MAQHFSGGPGASLDEQYMGEALYQARLSLEAGEVPVGAVLVIEDGQMVAHAHNFPISLKRPHGPRRDPGPAPGC